MTDDVDYYVSIHAPVMDAKILILRLVKQTIVSIHAPVMDANTALAYLQPHGCFNPRARDGREFTPSGSAM